MREIKFRAWDKDGRRMILASSVKMNAICSVEIQSLDKQAKLIRYELMQYIGLKETDGTEWYEGDIIEYYDEYEDTKTIHEIRYCANEGYPAFDLVPSLDVDSNGLAYIWQSGEGEAKVIGNIYENQELLKEIK